MQRDITTLDFSKLPAGSTGQKSTPLASPADRGLIDSRERTPRQAARLNEGTKIAKTGEESFGVTIKNGAGSLLSWMLRAVYRTSTKSPMPCCLRMVVLFLWILILPTIFAHHQDHQGCPGCPRYRDHHSFHQHNHHSQNHHHRQQSKASEGLKIGGTEPKPARNDPSPDDLRLEAIKHQILTKLGLRGRPDVNKTLASVSRNLALETLVRAEAQPQQFPPSFSQSGGGSWRQQKQPHSNTVHRHRAGIYNEERAYNEFFDENEEFSYKNMDQATERTTIVTEATSSTTTTIPAFRSDTSYGQKETGANGGGSDSEDRPSDDEQPHEEEFDDFYARTSEIITFAEPGHTLNGQPLLEFPMSTGEPVLGPLRIKKATLWALVEVRRTVHHYQHHRQGQNHQRNITLWVFRVRCGNATHLRGKELGQHLDMVTSLGVNIGQLGWQKFDVTSVVMDWYARDAKAQKDKLTLLVDCTGCGLHVHVSTFGHPLNEIEPSLNTQGKDDNRPFLVVHTDPTGVKRIRRRAVECNGPLMGQCCKQRFYVNFSQLGWDDWIIAPQGYYANYCRGDCGAGHRTPDTFLNYYTHVIEEYRKMDRLAGMQPCCAPLKFSSVSLIYYGPDSNIIKRDLPKMVVDECGCP
ncbi:uncharacterized protein LOC107228110 [Neodiprion lecontei]|uniref:Uncharacterized protein LOC107228110 n=1 Tax=Neodiprion lecontei TaxID=441921 RepID=A0A6J0CEB8_NEOLC|nr:uncharacterized protein LOC107228110 [Neodiprion lecontei]